MPNPERVLANIFPSLSYDDAQAAIEWLCRAFGFTERLLVPGPPGVVVHSELSLGNGVILVNSARPEEGRLSPRSLTGIQQTICVQVDDPDGHHARAHAAGAVIVQELEDTDYGARGYMAEDPEGHRWYFGNYRPGTYWKDEPPADSDG